MSYLNDGKMYPDDTKMHRHIRTEEDLQALHAIYRESDTWLLRFNACNVDECTSMNYRIKSKNSAGRKLNSGELSVVCVDKRSYI